MGFFTQNPRTACTCKTNGVRRWGELSRSVPAVRGHVLDKRDICEWIIHWEEKLLFFAETALGSSVGETEKMSSVGETENLY